MQNVRPPVRRGQRGFTLVELVVVIAILGILAAVALPRFTSLQREARVAKLQAFGGSIRAAAAQVKATALVRGVSCSTAAIGTGSSLVQLEGTTISLAYCYPDGTATGMVAAANLNATNDGVVMSTITGGALQVSLADGAGAAIANCNVTYTPPTAADGQPTVAVVSTGC